jgi:hypothetical protein
MNTKFYIAGKVTGLLYHEAVVKFAFSEQELIAAGIDAANIVNPMTHVPQGTSWKEALDIYIPLLEGCSAIYIQRDWNYSFGTKHLIKHAQQRRMDLYWEEMDDLKQISNLIASGI